MPGWTYKFIGNIVKLLLFVSLVNIVCPIDLDEFEFYEVGNELSVSDSRASIRNTPDTLSLTSRSQNQRRIRRLKRLLSHFVSSFSYSLVTVIDCDVANDIDTKSYFSNVVFNVYHRGPPHA